MANKTIKTFSELNVNIDGTNTQQDGIFCSSKMLEMLKCCYESLHYFTTVGFKENWSTAELSAHFLSPSLTI